MSLQEIKNLKDQKGFTIVELLIVIVVIGILAAIVIVAFNGVQARANRTASESAAKTIQKKLEAYNAVKTSYPITQSDMNGVTESQLTGSGITIGTPTASNGKNTVQINVCSTGSGASLTGVGAQIRFYDYTKTGGADVSDPVNVGVTSGTGVTCATTVMAA